MMRVLLLQAVKSTVSAPLAMVPEAEAAAIMGQVDRTVNPGAAGSKMNMITIKLDDKEVQNYIQKFKPESVTQWGGFKREIVAMDILHDTKNILFHLLSRT